MSSPLDPQRLRRVAITPGRVAREGAESLLERLEEVMELPEQERPTTVLLREKTLPPAELYPLALSVRQRVQPVGILLIVAQSLEVALAVEADGVQLGYSALPVAAARRATRHRPGFLIGASTHSLEKVLLAAEQGADYALLAPVREPSSKPSTVPPLGFDGFAEIVRHSPLPVVALGGLSPADWPKAERAGAAGIAGIGCFFP